MWAGAGADRLASVSPSVVGTGKRLELWRGRNAPQSVKCGGWCWVRSKPGGDTGPCWHWLAALKARVLDTLVAQREMR